MATRTFDISVKAATWVADSTIDLTTIIPKGGCLIGVTAYHGGLAETVQGWLRWNDGTTARRFAKISSVGAAGAPGSLYFPIPLPVLVARTGGSAFMEIEVDVTSATNYITALYTAYSTYNLNPILDIQTTNTTINLKTLYGSSARVLMVSAYTSAGTLTADLEYLDPTARKFLRANAIAPDTPDVKLLNPPFPVSGTGIDMQLVTALTITGWSHTLLTT